MGIETGFPSYVRRAHTYGQFTYDIMHLIPNLEGSVVDVNDDAVTSIGLLDFFSIGENSDRFLRNTFPLSNTLQGQRRFFQRVRWRYLAEFEVDVLVRDIYVGSV